MYSAHTAATSYTPQPSVLSDYSEASSLVDAFPRKSKCYFCGGSYHNRRVMHVVITAIRKFVVQTPMQAQQVLYMRILVQ